MKELQRLKPIAEQFFALSVKFLELIDADETKYAHFIEEVKKTPTERFYSSRGRLRRLFKVKTRKGKQLYISQKRSLIICQLFLNKNSRNKN